MDRRRLSSSARVFGGIEAAKPLRRAPVEVTVIDRQNHHCFQPLLFALGCTARSVLGTSALA
jgi:hypothetical protein